MGTGANGNGSGFKFSAFGATLQATGQQAVVILIVAGLLAGLGGVVYVHYRGFAALEAQAEAAAREKDQRLKQVAGEHQMLNEGLQAVIYVLTLDPDERKKLNLRMPATLRAMERPGP